MKGDYSRDTFDPAKHFTRVLMQQGRVQLDADWNEQGAILLHYLQTLAADLIGSYGGPLDQLGFEIRPPENDETELTDLSIGFGRYYVDGILCENYPPVTNVMQPKSPAGTPGGVEILETTGGHSRSSYRHQVNYPIDPQSEEFKKDLALFVYLDVWERHITAFEDDDIREVALGGPDTAARAKVVWQVKIIAVGKDAKQFDIDVLNVSCKEFEKNEAWKSLKTELQPENRGMLRARAYVPENSTDVCIVSPESRYRGAENQLYRVEIHNGGTAHPTFKWSRENGSTVYPIQSLSGQTVTLESMGRDERFGLEVGDWVEVVDDDYTLRGNAEPLLKVEALDSIEMMVTLNDAPGPHVGRNQKKHPLLRRWDQRAGDSKIGGLTLTDGAADVIERTKNNSHWLNLEDGVQVQFEPRANYRPGDYWLIPARTATGDVEWPGPPDNPRPLPPKGVEHHYAPLALVYPRAAGSPGRPFGVTDLRHRFAPVGQCCPTVTLDYPSTAAAADSPITFQVRISPPTPNLTFAWEVREGGNIQQTLTNPPSIKVNISDKRVTAEVTITGLPPFCPNIFRGTCNIT